LIITGGIAYAQVHKIEGVCIFWDIITVIEKYTGNLIVPVIIYSPFLYIIFSVFLCFAFLSLIFLIIYRNNVGINEGMFGSITKFHFIPLLCASALYIIGECFSVKENKYNVKVWNMGDEFFIPSLIFSAIGLFSLLSIWYKTSISDTPTRYVIKKGLYPSLTALFTYNLCYTIGLFGYIKSYENLTLDDLQAPLRWVKGASIAFSVIIGIINLGISIFMKDLVLSAMNLLIYIGLTIFFFKVPKDSRSQMNGEAEGIIDIIFGVASLATISFLIIKYKNSLLN
jgi:hypothetical protein